MALDIYVMPLWRFKAGDFRSPIEVATGIRPKIATPDGIEPGPAPVGWLGRWRARRQVAAIRRAVEAVHRARIRWEDEGGVVYAEQSRGIEPLRAFAKWLDCEEQFPEFTRPPDNDYYQHPVMPLELHRVSCPHLVWHDGFSTAIICRASSRNGCMSSRTRSSGTGPRCDRSDRACACSENWTACRSDYRFPQLMTTRAMIPCWP